MADDVRWYLRGFVCGLIGGAVAAMFTLGMFGWLP